MTNKKSELEYAIEQLISEGYSMKDIKNTLDKIIKEAMKQPTIKNLDELLDKITEDNKHEEQITDRQGEELI